MSRTGRAAQDWIACDLVLINANELWASQYGVIPESDVHRLAIVAELDTGSSELGLPPEEIKRLELQPLGQAIQIASALDGKVTKVFAWGPVVIDFCGKTTTIEAYELKHTPRVLLGLEPAQRLKIDVNWVHSKVILPATAYLHRAYTITPNDILNLFGPDGTTIEALQRQHAVSIEINNRRKATKIVVVVCTQEKQDNLQEAEATIRTICASLNRAPEEERP